MAGNTVVKFSLKFFGINNVKINFKNYGAKIKDLNSLFNDLTADFYKMEQRQFTNQGSPKKWAQLSPKYKAWKDKHFPRRTILRLTGSLRSAATRGKLSGSKKIKPILLKTKKALTIGVKGDYVWTHQAGYRKKNIPARPFYQIQKKDVKRWREIYRKHQAETIKEVF